MNTSTSTGSSKSSEVVVKVYSIVEEEMLAAYLTERQILTDLPPHPNIVKMFECFEHENKAYLVLERAGELTLAQYMKQNEGMLKIDQVRTISFQLLSAVAFLHSQRIVHRDIKPDNIMLSVVGSELHTKLIDFNVSHSFAHDPEMKGKTGIQEWSAPETRKLACYNEKCDIWSVGCILYFLCTGHVLAGVHDIDQRA